MSPLYLTTTRNTYIGFNTQNYLTILTHLYVNYVENVSSGLLLNNKATRKPYKANISIENLFEHIDTAVEYKLAGRAPYTSIQIRIDFQFISYTYLLPYYCRLLRKREIVDKHMPNSRYSQPYTSRYEKYRPPPWGAILGKYDNAAKRDNINHIKHNYCYN